MSMKKIFAALVAVTLFLSVLAYSNGQNCIVVSSTMEEFRNTELQEQLKRRFPDKHIVVNYISTGKLAAKVASEGASTESDIIVSLDAGYMSKIKDFIAPLPQDISHVPYLPEFKPDQNYNKWVTWEKPAGAIVLNTEILKKYNLPEPKTYQDLLNPIYRDLVAMPDPQASGTGYLFLKSWVNAFGEDAAFDYVDQLHKNIKSFSDSGSGPLDALERGEVAIGLGLTYQAVDKISEGHPLKIIFAPEGSPFYTTGTALTLGRDQRPEIVEVFDFIVNDFMVYDKEHYSPEQLYEGQQNLVQGYPQNIPYADMYGMRDDKEKERLLNRWKY